LVAAFSLSSLFFFNVSMAQPAPAPGGETAAKESAKLDPAKIILEHVADAHEFHFFTLNKKTGVHSAAGDRVFSCKRSVCLHVFPFRTWERVVRWLPSAE